MNVTKNNIIRNINIKSSISVEDSYVLLESFLSLVKTQAKLRKVKINSFGVFAFKKTPNRIGRNPKTQDSYIIPTMSKLNFKPSNKIKEKIN